LLEFEIEGYEFILNIGASHVYRKFMDIFNRSDLHKTASFETYAPPSEVNIIDAVGANGPKYLILETGGFCIINKFSTKGFLKTLDQINKSVTYQLLPEDKFKLVYKSNENIDINFYNEYMGCIKERI
jgi:hypothetical protein